MIGTRANYADTAGVSIGTTRLVHEAGSIRVRANFDPIGADSAELILRESDEITGRATFPTGGDLAAYPAEAPFISDIQSAVALPGRNVPQNPCGTDGEAVCVGAGFQATRSVTLSDGAFVQADELILIPRGASEPFRPERLSGLSRLEIGGTNLERMVLRSATATYPLRGPDIRGTLAGRLSGHVVEGTCAGAIDTVSGETDLYVTGVPPAVGERLRLAIGTSHLIGAAYGPRSGDAVNLSGITGDSITARTEVRADEDLAGPEGDSLYAVETVLKRSSEIVRVDAQISGGLPRVSPETDLTWASAGGHMRPVGPDSLAEVFNRAVRGDFDGDGTAERHVLELTMQVGSVETSLPGVQRIGAAGLQTSFADSTSRWENERTGFGPGRERARLDGIPLRAAGDALLRARSGGSEYRIENTGLGGDDGARLSAPTDTAYRDLTAEFEPVPIPTAKPQAPQIRWDRSGLYLSLQGTYPDSARIPIGQARLAVRAGTTRVVADFTPVGADHVRLISLQNGAVSGTATVPGGETVAWRSGRDVTVRSVSGSPRPCNGSGEAVPCLGYKFQYNRSFTAADGTVLEGNELLILAENSSGPFAEGGLEGFTELRIGASNLEPLLLTTLTGDPESTPIPPRVADLPDRYRLEQNYPNPFNPSTTIHYALPEASQVTLTVYDILGRRVRRLVDSQQGPGRHEVQFDASDLPSGLYFYRLQAGSVIRTQSMILAK